jgi:alcohol dehydrogenase class IV
MYPSRHVFGCGCFEMLGDLSKDWGDRALVVTGRKAMREFGTLDKAISLLRSTGIEAVAFDRVEPEPSTHTVDVGREVAVSEECQIVIGIGGGSALDAAKAIACLAKHPGPSAEYQSGERKITHEGIPFIAVPTTAGTGAEVTKNSVLIDRDRDLKASIRSPHMLAKIALVDPLLTVSAPPSVTASAGMDALTQAIESYVSLASNPVSDVLAIEAVTHISASLLKAYRDGGDTNAREEVMLGSFMTALSFGNASLGAVHGLAHPVGAHYGISHGVACAILLPHVMRYNLDVRRSKYNEIAEAMGLEPIAEKAVDRVNELLTDLELPRKLSDFGVNEDDLGKAASAAAGSSLRNNPRPTSKEDLTGMLKAAL